MKQAFYFSMILLFLVFGMATAFSQSVTLLSDYEYEERCAKFSPADPACGVTIRPRSAPLDCNLPDFSPTHPFCTAEQKQRDLHCDNFSPKPPGCP